jgi:hypothetical protein
MTLNHIFSLMTFAIGALCFVAFITILKPPLYHSETAVGSIYGRERYHRRGQGSPVARASQANAAARSTPNDLITH